jgi:polyisoprenyl-phosphate glycosyltransferase
MTAAATQLSVLIPVHNEEQNIEPLLARLLPALGSVQGACEVIFVNDGSTDATAERLDAACRRDPRVRALHLSRNFGHQPAISAAMDYAAGEAAVIMDGDLQDPPEVLPTLIAKWREGYQVVHAVREERQGETFFKRMTAYFFYRILKSVTQVPIAVDSGDFRLLDRSVVLALRGFPEKSRFLRGLVSWVGYRQATVSYVREARAAGSTKFSLSRMVRFATDAITSFSILPLRLATTLGALFSFGAFLYALTVLYAHFFSGRTVSGWTSQMIVTLFFGGVQLLFLGVLGEYVGRIFEEVKRRPLYLISRREGFDER